MNNMIAAALLLSLVLLFSSAAGDSSGEMETTYVPGVHVCGGVEFDKPLSGDLSRQLESGNYYLTGDCIVRNHVMITGEVSICLNGYKIDVHNARTLHVGRGGVLSIYDCSGEGLVGFTGGTDHNHPVTVDAGGTFNLYGGWLYAKNGSNAINSKGTVNIFGGLVESCDPGYCVVRNESELNLYGGMLRGYLGVSQRGRAVMHICGESFVIDTAKNAVQYVSRDRPLYIDTPHYLWRTDPEGEFVSSAEQPYVYADRTAYLEFAFPASADNPAGEGAPSGE